MKKWLLLPVCFLLIGLVFICSRSTNGGYKSPITIESAHGSSGKCDYKIIYKNSARIDFKIKRPDVNDSHILLSIPGAFTRLDNDSVDGLCICNGYTHNRHGINHSLSGVIEMVNGECTIFRSYRGSTLTDSLITSLERKHGSLFQQSWLVVNDSCAHYKDSSLFVRRAIVKFNTGKTAIIESSEAITLWVFANDLKALGVKDALYTDMGAWDEGWYKNPDDGKVFLLGDNYSQTQKQSNWVVFELQ